MLKKITLLVLMFFIIGIYCCFSQEIVNSQIKKVVLFTNQALITREADVRVKKGLNEIFLGIEAFNLDRDSISAKVYGEGSLYSVQYKEIYLKEPSQKRLKELEEKLNDLRNNRNSLIDQLDILSKKEKFLDSLVNFSDTQLPKDIKTSFPGVDDLERILDFLEKSLQDIILERQDLKRKIANLDKDIEILEKELNSLRQPAERTKKIIEIVFDSKKDQVIKIKVDYIVYGCSWHPFYKADVSWDLDKVDLIMFSRIRQKTGEDWKNISLSISNVIPLRGGRLPSLSSWFLDAAKPVMYRKKESRFAQKVVEHAFYEYEKNKAGAADFVYAEKKELPLSFEYQLPQILSIESKDKDTLLPLFSKSLKGDFFYYSVPKISPLTFLVCKTASDKELLSGPLNIYFGGRFVGKTYLTEKKSGQDFYLNLGVDREIKIKREKIKDKIQETFFGKIERKTVIRELEFKIIVENLKEKSIKIKIIDSIPVSKTDKVEVKNINLRPQPKKKNYQDKEGVNLWEFEVKPKEKKQINIEFTVTYPKGISLYGL